MYFPKVSDIDEVAQNILQKRYLRPDETSWEDITRRVVDWVIREPVDDQKELTYEMILNRYFVPNSPCLVNSGKDGGGLIACFVVDFPDSIDGIYKTKYDFALIARKGGGCGTTLSKLRPEGSLVSGSSHGYAGGPVKFFDTICHDMEVITQAGFREMAMMGTMSVYHPDIIKFITAKTTEGKMRTTNISVVVDNNFMKCVLNDSNYVLEWNGISYGELNAREVFNLIVEGAWKNGEPGLLFYEKLNNSPYNYTGQVIEAVNPCGEQPLPANGCCNLGALDLSKFLNEDNTPDLESIEVATKLSVRFLDSVIDVNSYPTKDIEEWALKNRPVGLGIMGLADLYLKMGIAYGSKQSIDLLEFLLNFIYKVAEEESIILGEEKGVPDMCKLLPTPRRNITLLTIAPTGTTSLIAGCNSGIEPIFSEITIRKDKTGTYQMVHPLADKDYFRCAVSANGTEEVTWMEHILIQNSAQRFVDSGVSKTINFPNHTHRSTIYDSFMMAWSLQYIKGITVYRNGSRDVEVLSPKNLKKDKCPLCDSDLISEAGCKHCSSCDFSVCEV